MAVAEVGPRLAPFLRIALVVPVVCLDGHTLPQLLGSLALADANLLLAGLWIDDGNLVLVRIAGVVLLFLLAPLSVLHNGTCG